jgi:hypothetical protein
LATNNTNNSSDVGVNKQYFHASYYRLVSSGKQLWPLR